MSIKRILTVALMSCLLFIIDAAASDYEKCMEEAEKYLSKKQYEEYGSAIEKCSEILIKEMEKSTGRKIKILESAMSLDEALKKPARIGKLSINLYTEKIERLPDEFAKLTNLEELKITGINARDYWGIHRFDIRDAMNKIIKIANLKALYLSGDLKAEDIKMGIKNLKQLKSLTLFGVNEIPAEIGNLTNLEELFLEGKDISVVPPVIGNLQKLIRLSISKTNISTLPVEIGKLKNLESLGLSQNKLVSFPPSMRNLTGLKALEIWGNPIAEQWQWEEVL